MTTLDDKILGEKLQYYCSSSEDEGSDNEDGEGESKTIRDATASEPEIYQSTDGSAVNTGPKGVINDFRKYKQMKVEQKQEQKREMERLIKKLSMTCRSDLDLEKDEEKKKQLQEKIKDKVRLQTHDDDDDEAFLQQYRMQRMEEMKRHHYTVKRFAQVFELNDGQDFLDALDKEDRHTIVIIHIYEPDVPGCEAMRGSLLCLAQEYTRIKFCSVRSSCISTSELFRDSALPALLVYQGGDMVGNFVRLTDQLGDDFFAVDVEVLLQEHGLLTDKIPHLGKQVVRNGTIIQTVLSDDSDLDID
ncbi:phosducin-like protein isoform X2 [Nelusetta ayraudi]|uniref:phosducin-like protein isoform X2 n=1 Tax=Nelusetta ayraudi TaxID=303726 RepID=UPI003F716571